MAQERCPWNPTCKDCGATPCTECKKETEKIWGVRNVTKGGWCCLEHGLMNSDDPWRSTRERANAVFDYLSARFPHVHYEVKLYSRTEGPHLDNGLKVIPTLP